MHVYACFDHSVFSSAGGSIILHSSQWNSCNFWNYSKFPWRPCRISERLGDTVTIWRVFWWSRASFFEFKFRNGMWNSWLYSPWYFIWSFSTLTWRRIPPRIVALNCPLTLRTRLKSMDLERRYWLIWFLIGPPEPWRKPYLVIGTDGGEGGNGGI